MGGQGITGWRAEAEERTDGDTQNRVCRPAAVTSYNKQVAPTPRDAQLRRTPAQAFAGPVDGAGRIEARSFGRTRGGAGVAVLERSPTPPQRGGMMSQACLDGRDGVA